LSLQPPTVLLSGQGKTPGRGPGMVGSEALPHRDPKRNSLISRQIRSREVGDRPKPRPRPAGEFGLRENYRFRAGLGISIRQEERWWTRTGVIVASIA